MILLFVESTFTAVNWFFKDHPSSPILYLFKYYFFLLYVNSEPRPPSSPSSSSISSSGSGIGLLNFTPMSWPACILNNGGFCAWMSSKSQNLKIWSALPDKSNLLSYMTTKLSIDFDSWILELLQNGSVLSHSCKKYLGNFPSKFQPMRAPSWSPVNIRNFLRSKQQLIMSVLWCDIESSG